ncbi:TOM1-like protein 1 [Gastrolobium bilobum]|uniref:TOM1-like protein 1 n=1 Tax=Gastrolobium bilobum TaxID=150636 RepID=UPI002AB274F7|nr:TOM1-like protein 1 [Gastrolobium bilobum]
MSEDLIGKVNAFGERIRIGGAEVGRKMSASMSSMSFKVKEFFQEPNHADKLVGDATSEALDDPDWAIILHICDLVNTEKLNTAELVRAIKKRVVTKSPRGQYLALVLLEALVQNCDKAFSEVSAERVLDEMVKLIDDPQTVLNNRNKALIMIEAWGELTTELRYLPVYAETYKSLKSRGIRFPARDNESLAPFFTPPLSASAPEADVSLAQLIQHDSPVQSFTPEQAKEAFDVARNSTELLFTVLSSSSPQGVLKDDLATTLVQQCLQSQATVQRIVETAEDNEVLLFEALNVNDEIQKVLSKYNELKKPAVVPLEPEPAMIPVAIEPDESPRFTKEDGLIRKPAAGSRVGVHGGNHDDMIDDLDEMIFGKKGADTSHRGQDPNKQQSSKNDLISF